MGDGGRGGGQGKFVRGISALGNGTAFALGNGIAFALGNRVAFALGNGIAFALGASSHTANNMKELICLRRICEKQKHIQTT